jgi:hypothetical protein
MLARLRLLLAMSLLLLGTWFAALAIAAYLPSGRTVGTEASAPSPASSAAVDAQQFISLLTRERFVVDAPPTGQVPVKARPPSTAVKAKLAVEKHRPPAGARWPWPLNLLAE